MGGKVGRNTMRINSIDESQRKALRTAGLLYLLLAITAPIGLLYVPSTLIVTGDATATADHIRASESLLRIGIASELFHQTGSLHENSKSNMRLLSNVPALSRAVSSIREISLITPKI